MVDDGALTAAAAFALWEQQRVAIIGKEELERLGELDSLSLVVQAMQKLTFSKHRLAEGGRVRVETEYAVEGKTFYCCRQRVLAAEGGAVLAEAYVKAAFERGGVVERMPDEVLCLLGVDIDEPINHRSFCGSTEEYGRVCEL